MTLNISPSPNAHLQIYASQSVGQGAQGCRKKSAPSNKTQDRWPFAQFWIRTFASMKWFYSAFRNVILFISLAPSLTHGFCSLDPSNQEELGGSWVVDSFLSDLLCGNCSRPTFSINDSENDEEENNNFDSSSVIGFQQVLQPHTLMVTFSPVPSNILRAHSYWMCQALARPRSVLISAGRLTLHLLSDSATYQYVLSKTEEGAHTLSFWSTEASAASSALTAPLSKHGGRLYLGSPSLTRYLPLMRTAHTGRGEELQEQGTLPSSPSIAQLRSQVKQILKCKLQLRALRWQQLSGSWTSTKMGGLELQSGPPGWQEEGTHNLLGFACRNKVLFHMDIIRDPTPLRQFVSLF